MRFRAGVGMLAACLLASLVVTSAAAALAPRHPKAHSWMVRNKSDIEEVIGGLGVVTSDMVCDPSIDPCSPGVHETPDPGSWPPTISDDCPLLTGNVSIAQSDGPIPSRTAQRWWSDALQDIVAGCRAVEKASAAYTVDIRAGKSTSFDPRVREPGSVAAADISSANKLVSRVERYVGLAAI